MPEDIAVIDLATLVTMCSLGVNPDVMRSLVWHTSRGQPWSFGVHGDAAPRAFATLDEAHDAALLVRPQGPIRIGLAGLATDLSSAAAQPAAALFAMCPNVFLASRRLVEIEETCRRSPVFRADPEWCALAVYRGSFDRPDGAFAEAVLLGALLDDVPNPELPSEAEGVVTPPKHATDKPTAAQPGNTVLTPELQIPPHTDGWQSALFQARKDPVQGADRAKPMPLDGKGSVVRRGGGEQVDSVTEERPPRLFVPLGPSRRERP